MTPLDYAHLCIAEHFQINKEDLTLMVKGRGHAPRVKVDRGNPFFRKLTTVKIVTSEYGGTEWYTTEHIFNMYVDGDLLAAGIDPFADQGRAALPRCHHYCIVHRPAWTAAQVYVRLTGKPFPAASVPVRAAAVRKYLDAKRDRTEKKFDQQLNQLIRQGAL